MINPSDYASTILAIEGNIGAGKTHLAHKIVEYLVARGVEAKYFEEYVNDLLLGQFISNPAKYAYAFQLFMLNKRIETYNLAKAYADSGGCAILDRSLVGDKVFMYLHYHAGNIIKSEKEVYESIAQTEARLALTNIIYLDVSVETSLHRIMKRGRASESSYSPAYLEKIRQHYEESLKEVSYVRIDWNLEKPEIGTEEVEKVLGSLA